MSVLTKRPARQLVLAHTAAPPFVRQAALAFQENDSLRLACIGLATRESDWTMRALATLPGLANVQALFRRRLFEELPSSKLRRHARWEWLRLLTARVDRSGIWTDRIWDVGTRRFDRWAAAQLQAGDLAYGYEYACLHFFERAQSLALPRVYEIPSAEHDYYNRIMAAELARFPDLRTAWHDATASKQAERSKRRHDELALADRVIVYSSHVVDSYRDSGFDTSRFRVVPLGAPPPIPTPLQKPDGPLRLIWAGTFGIRKGAHYLLEALERFPRDEVQLDIYGSYALSDSWRGRMQARATFHGPVSYSALLSAMAKAHALILPSLSEAFGMVVTEALACATPVIVSRSVGASDLVRHGANGLIVPPGDAAAIQQAIAQLLNQRAQLPNWDLAARDAAAAWQWSDYRSAMRAALQDLLSA